MDRNYSLRLNTMMFLGNGVVAAVLPHIYGFHNNSDRRLTSEHGVSHRVVNSYKKKKFCSDRGSDRQRI